jgi:hypothetical protein
MVDEAVKELLLVEDEAIVALDEKLRLERIGFRVELAHSVEAAVERILADRPGFDLVLMDIDLGRAYAGPTLPGPYSIPGTSPWSSSPRTTSSRSSGPPRASPPTATSP